MRSSKRGVSFIGSITLMLTLIVFQSTFFMKHIEPRELFMIITYILIALATNNYRGVIDLVERIWYINDNGNTEDEKFALIKSFLQINVSRWDKYNNLYAQIVNGQNGSSALKRYLLRIPKGTISLKQFLWILAYIIYTVFSTDMFSPAIDFLINLGGLSFFLFTGSSVVGLTDFMEDIFESLKDEDGKTIKQSLQLLESQIVYGSRQYGFLKNKIELKKEEIK